MQKKNDSPPFGDRLCKELKKCHPLVLTKLLADRFLDEIKSKHGIYLKKCLINDF